MRGSHPPPPPPPPPKSSLQLGKFSLRHAIRVLSGMFPFAFWVIGTWVCEAVKVGSACMHTSLLDYLGKPELLKECLPYACVSQMPHVMLLGFAYNVNHVNMMSSGFEFHPCHVGLTWHDIIGVHIA